MSLPASLAASLPRSLARLCLVGGAGAVIVAATWAVPVGDDPGVIESAGAARSIAPAVDLPAIDLPAVGAETEVLVAAAPEPAPAPEAAAEHEAEEHAESPDHLTPEPDATPEPVLVTTAPTTTTTAPPATAPPTTTTVAPTTTTAVAPAVTVAFSATQQYGSCSEPVPYDVFSGTATPGSTVTISSPYGSGTTTADSAGHWTRTVEFPDAPRGVAFSVTVSGLGGSTSLSFVATGGTDHG